ncbi:hypothetical protein [Chryseolinea sp. H1M3-3]|uniref:hypothetical protein n=1 Tax=Chryseolinea sp. H1M3-3 TaxID=3034144 RepID=UPI0023EDD0B3|nr:hypothetical protein [Chryseolinea sp. H1M3-3]
MKPHRLAFFAILLFVTIYSHAQDYAFKVLVNKGKNELKSGNNWQQLKVGSSLKSADELKVSENSYLGLVHVSGKALELKQSGNYKVMELAAKVNGGSSVLNKYTDFILSSATSPKNRLAATGAVDRGDDNIEVYLPKPENAVVYNNNVIIQWDAEKAQGPYVVKFNSMFDDELDKIETKENSISIDLNDQNFVNEDNIIVEVSSASDKNKISKRYTLKKLSKADTERIKNELSKISNTTAEPNALNKLLVAGFYEQNNLLIDAGTAYIEAIKLAADVPQYAEAYNDFLLRYNMKKAPKK